MKRKRIPAFCAAFTLIAAVLPSEMIPSGQIASGSTVEPAEIKAASAHLLGGTALSLDAADRNSDKLVNAADLAIAKRLALGLFPAAGEIPLLINELCASNNSVLADKHGNYGDWIEIYNYSQTQSVNLDGMGLSDNPEKPFKYVFPDVTLGPGQYLIVFASASSANDGEELHTDFNLSADGEFAVLTHPVLGLVDSVEFPALTTDITYGRYENGSETFFPLTPTAGMSNDLAQVINNSAQVQAPVFSHQSGFYNDPFTLTMNSATENAVIYYTTDCSDPTVSSTRYTAAVGVNSRTGDPNLYSMTPNTSVYSTYTPWNNIDKATIIRAVAVDAEGNVSNISTATYFVGAGFAEKYKNFSLISVVTDPDNLYDYNTGIYVKGAVYDQYKKGGWGFDDGSTPCNYNQRGREWEREAFFDFFDSSKNLVVSSGCGIRIHGGWTRAYLQKSLRIIARGEYGGGKFNAPLIPGLVKESDGVTPLEKFDTFILRNGGNSSEYVKFKCAYIQKLLEDRSFDTQGSNPVVGYLDGEYWGLYMIREDFDDNYIENNYDIPKDDVIIVKVGLIDEGEPEDQPLYDDLINFARSNDMTNPANYERICAMMDIQNFADYFAAQLFINNEDWPHNNFRVWRSRTVDPANPYQDGKWRWMLYDTEMSMDLYDSGRNYSFNSLEALMRENNSPYNEYVIVFQSLIKNSEFKRIFTTAFMDIVNVNFDYEPAMALLAEYEALYRPMIEDQYARFGPTWVKNPSQFVTEEIEGMRYFIRNRRDYVPTMLRNNLGLGASYTLTLTSSGGGKIIVNGTSEADLSDGSWTGTYFEDYPVTLTAVPDSGKSFAGWSGASTSGDASITLTLSQALSLRAEFN